MEKIIVEKSINSLEMLEKLSNENMQTLKGGGSYIMCIDGINYLITVYPDGTHDKVELDAYA